MFTDSNGPGSESAGDAWLMSAYPGRYRARSWPVIANMAVRAIYASGAILVLILIVCFFKEVEIGPGGWQLLLGVFGGATVIVAVLTWLSSRYDYFSVDETGLAYRVPGGHGEASLFKKKSGKAAWDEITEAAPSRFLPYRNLDLYIRRGTDGKPDWIFLPLYLENQDAFMREVLNHAPEGHCLRTCFERGNG